MPSSLPGMHAVTIVDGALEWREHPDPEPGPGQVVVGVRAAGINGADLAQRRGVYPPPPGWPVDIPGLELAGTVVGRGAGADRFAVGDRVMGIVGGGGQAELAVTDETTLLPVPDSMSWVEAGGCPEVFTTAYDALFSQAGLVSGEHVLVTDGAGDVGTAGIQLAACAGARVTASVRNPSLFEAVQALGAQAVIPPDTVGSSGPYDVVLELVGAASLTGVIPALGTGARVVVIGVSGGGARLEISLMDLMSRRARIGGSTLRARPLAEKTTIARTMEAEVVPLLADRRAVVPLVATYPMAEADQGYERFAAGGKVGKIVLVND